MDEAVSQVCGIWGGAWQHKSKYFAVPPHQAISKMLALKESTDSNAKPHAVKMWRRLYMPLGWPMWSSHDLNIGDPDYTSVHGPCEAERCAPILETTPSEVALNIYICVCVCVYIAEKGEGESQRETNMVVQDWEEKNSRTLIVECL